MTPGKNRRNGVNEDYLALIFQVGKAVCFLIIKTFTFVRAWTQFTDINGKCATISFAKQFWYTILNSTKKDAPNIVIGKMKEVFLEDSLQN